MKCKKNDNLTLFFGGMVLCVTQTEFYNNDFTNNHNSYIFI